VRCFVACFLRPVAAEHLAAALPEIPGCRRVAAANLHVTLHFIGNLDAGAACELQALVETLDGVATIARVLEVTGFPRPDRARTAVATLAVDDRLLAWQQRLAEAWPTGEDRRFRPHVTLGRAKRPTSVAAAPGLEDLEIGLQPPGLYVSETLPEGARYSRFQPSG
jgi:2'-5' RNA ligase